mmetsp:Transcript_10801/g.31989  ORF Transcript_10801/g.31989 Transcript_10801/m.31989 type:complete len:244 (-) Transcript_10801:196-927(-)
MRWRPSWRRYLRRRGNRSTTSSLRSNSCKVCLTKPPPPSSRRDTVPSGGRRTSEPWRPGRRSWRRNGTTCWSRWRRRGTRPELGPSNATSKSWARRSNCWMTPWNGMRRSRSSSEGPRARPISCACSGGPPTRSWTRPGGSRRSSRRRCGRARRSLRRRRSGRSGRRRSGTPTAPRRIASGTAWTRRTPSGSGWRRRPRPCGPMPSGGRRRRPLWTNCSAFCICGRWSAKAAPTRMRAPSTVR